MKTFKLFSPRRDRTAAMPFIMLTVLIDMVTIGLIIPVLPTLVGSFTGSNADQAFWYGAVVFAFGIANFFGAPLLSMVSHLLHGDWRIGAPMYFCALLQAASLTLAYMHFRGEREPGAEHAVTEATR